MRENGPSGPSGESRIVVGITGASGVIYGIELLKALSSMPVETHLILTEAAKRTISMETDFRVEQVEAMAKVVHHWRDYGAAPASGSFLTRGMAIVPCTIKTLSAIVNSYNDNLLVRAADVCIKERRRLVLAVRETPLHLGHLRLMCQAVEMGAVVLPPIPGFYHRPSSVHELVAHVVGKILDQLGIEHQLFRRWEGPRDGFPYS
ncbi:MAG: UbiX family flavin prenyltransferase [Thermodesulfobacteriota bacterium]